MATHRQRRAAAIIVESRGRKPVGRAMVEAGYDETTAKIPKNLTESDGYKEALAELNKPAAQLSDLEKYCAYVEVPDKGVYYIRTLPPQAESKKRGEAVKNHA